MMVQAVCLWDLAAWSGAEDRLEWGPLIGLLGSGPVRDADGLE